MSECVFIIINEWTEDDTDYEVVWGDQFWASEADALVELREIAQMVNQVILDGESAFEIDESRLFGLERDTYYIRKLAKG